MRSPTVKQAHGYLKNLSSTFHAVWPCRSMITVVVPTFAPALPFAFSRGSQSMGPRKDTRSELILKGMAGRNVLVRISTVQSGRSVRQRHAHLAKTTRSVPWSLFFFLTQSSRFNQRRNGRLQLRHYRYKILTGKNLTYTPELRRLVLHTWKESQNAKKTVQASCHACHMSSQQVPHTNSCALRAESPNLSKFL